MKILMMTNTYLPHVGGVARSVESFAEAFRDQGHQVLIVAPEFEGMPENEKDVLRVPAIRRFNQSDFSVRLPLGANLRNAVEAFEADIVHSQHPFLLGATALRVARGMGVPIVFTHHTMYEEYTHYVPGDSDLLKRAVADIPTGYANLCDHVFAPSESVATLIRDRGVEVPIDVVPTGVALEGFERGSGEGMRAILGIPGDAFLIGHVGRMAPEKNLPFLTKAVVGFMAREADSHFLVAGTGPWLPEIRKAFAQEDLSKRLHTLGSLSGTLLVSAYKAMDVFAFASQTETQGMVVTESMAAGTPVIAVDASGVREVVNDGRNGYLLPHEDDQLFMEALSRYAGLDQKAREKFRGAALDTARKFSMQTCAEKALALFHQTIEEGSTKDLEEDTPWSLAVDRARAEWDLIANAAGAFGSAVFSRSETDAD